MEEVRLLYLKDDEENAVYVPEKFWDTSCEPERYYVFREDELDERGKLYLNALRIIKDRSLQQVEKAKADENGYRLIRANKRQYKDDRSSWSVAWLIKKETPYSVKMPLDVVVKEVEDDLYHHYHYVKVTDVKKTIQIINMGHLDATSHEAFANMLRERGLFGKALSLEIQEMTTNIGSGHYEVTYWATGLV